MKITLAATLSKLFLPEVLRNVVTSALTEPHRKYHNIDHIEHLLNLAAAEGYEATASRSMVEAIVYHDIVHYPQGKLNEDFSALVYMSASNQTSPVLRQSVVNAIMASKDHTNDEFEKFRETAPWILDFLDYDMEGLAHNFYSNSRKLYAEYSPYVTDEQFFDGRLAFFKKLEASKRIFWNHPEWEEKARKNIEGEIARMEVMLVGEGEKWVTVSPSSRAGEEVEINGRREYIRWMTMVD